jgi:hypothetical protein
MPADESPPRDPHERRRPKDSEFYQIPPDLKKEFELMMAGRGTPAPAPRAGTDRARRLGVASLWLGVAGFVVPGVGPFLAVLFGVLALRRPEGAAPEVPPAAAKAGIALGILAALSNAVAALLVWRLLIVA